MHQKVRNVFTKGNKIPDIDKTREEKEKLASLVRAIAYSFGLSAVVHGQTHYLAHRLSRVVQHQTRVKVFEQFFSERTRTDMTDRLEICIFINWCMPWREDTWSWLDIVVA